MRPMCAQVAPTEFSIHLMQTPLIWLVYDQRWTWEVAEGSNVNEMMIIMNWIMQSYPTRILINIWTCQWYINIEYWFIINQQWTNITQSSVPTTIYTSNVWQDARVQLLFSFVYQWNIEQIHIVKKEHPCRLLTFLKTRVDFTVFLHLHNSGMAHTYTIHAK